MDWLGLFESCHRLFSQAFVRFAVALGTTRVVEVSSTLPGDGLLALADGVAEDGAAAATAGEVPADTLGPTAGGGLSAEAWEDLQQRQAKYRGFVLDGLVACGHLADCIVLRIALRPHMTLIRSLMLLGSDKWLLQQEAKLLQGLGQDKHGIDLREYRGVVAASRTLERVVISTANSLFSDERLWDAVPAAARTVARRVQSFALLSRTLCLATSMEEMHSEYPFRLFLLLLDPSLSQQVKAEKCQMDPWSLAFVEHHEARDGLGSSNALHDLLTSVIMGWWDTAPLESRHASIRRSIVSLSCQTHLASFVDLSAREVLRRYRKVVQRASNIFGPPAKEKNDPATKPQSHVPARSQGQHQLREGEGAAAHGELSSQPITENTATTSGMWQHCIVMCPTRTKFGLMNLVVNALRHTGEATMTSKICLAHGNETLT